MTWIGHGTALIDLEETRLLTDPVLRDRFAHLRRVGAPAAPLGRVDVVLVTHTHRDHLDLPSLRILDRRPPVVAPRAAARTIAALGFAEVIEVVAGDVVDVAGTRVEATLASHSPGRGLLRRGPEPVGYLVGDELTTYVAGDTGLTTALAPLRDRIDVALLPISGWGPRLPAGHLDPVDAARLLRMLRPHVCIPVHWGTFRPVYRRRPYESDAAAPDRLVLFAAALAPTVEVRVLQPGSSWSRE